MSARVVSVASLVLIMAAAAQAQEADLDGFLDRLGSSWARGDAIALVERGARAGITFQLNDEKVGPLSERQATAVLRRLFDGRTTLSMRQGMAQVVGGSPPRAFGELAWTTRATGTTVPERSTVIVALVRERDEWRITQIRLIQ